MNGVLLMAYGTPRTAEDTERYYTDIRGGAKPSADQMARLLERYEAIGGASPLYRITECQAEKLQAVLDERGANTKVYFGMKHSDPSIRTAIAAASRDGITDLVCIALAPHYSIIGIGAYINMVKEANASLGNKINISFIESWHLNGNLIRFWSESIRAAGGGTGDTLVVFSAHSLPESVEDKGPYKKQLLETATAVASEAGAGHWVLAFQSQSDRGGKWYGPKINEAILSERKAGETVVVAPIGFVSDNLELLYDIDIECMKWAHENGIRMARAKAPNDSDEIILALESLSKVV